jgi:hypothetical protein
VYATAVRDLRVLHKSQIESREHEDDADIRHEPFPEALPEEQHIYTDDNDYQHRNVKHDGCGFCHFDYPFKQVESELAISVHERSAKNTRDMVQCLT